MALRFSLVLPLILKMKELHPAVRRGDLPEATTARFPVWWGWGEELFFQFPGKLFFSWPMSYIFRKGLAYSGEALDCAGGDPLTLLSCTQSPCKANRGLQAPLSPGTLRTPLDHQCFGGQGVSPGIRYSYALQGVLMISSWNLSEYSIQ